MDNPLLQLPYDESYKNSKLIPFPTQEKAGLYSPTRGNDAPVSGYYATPEGSRVFTKIMMPHFDEHTGLYSDPHVDAAREVLASDIGRMINPTLFPQTKIIRRRLDSKNPRKNFSQIVSAYVHGYPHNKHPLMSEIYNPKRDYMFDLYSKLNPRNLLTDYLHTIITNPGDYHPYNSVITESKPHKYIGIDRSKSFYPHHTDIDWNPTPNLYNYWIRNPEVADIPLDKEIIGNVQSLKRPVLSQIIERLTPFYKKEVRRRIPRLILERYKTIDKLARMKNPTVKDLMGTNNLPYK